MNPKVKYLLNGMNLAWSREKNEDLFLMVMDTTSKLPDISVADMRFIHNLISDTARLVISREGKRKTRTTILYDEKKEEELFHSCKELNNVIKAVTDDRVTSMFKVVELLFTVFRWNVPKSEDIFVTSLETSCTEKKLQKISRQFIDYFTTVLNYNSSPEVSKVLISLLNKIKNNDQLSTFNGSVIIKCHKMIEEKLDVTEYQHSSVCTHSKCLYTFNYLNTRYP